MSSGLPPVDHDHSGRLLKGNSAEGLGPLRIEEETRPSDITAATVQSRQDSGKGDVLELGLNPPTLSHGLGNVDIEADVVAVLVQIFQGRVTRVRAHDEFALVAEALGRRDGCGRGRVFSAVVEESPSSEPQPAPMSAAASSATDYRRQPSPPPSFVEHA